MAKKKDNSVIATTKESPSKKEKDQLTKDLTNAGGKPVKNAGDVSVIMDVHDRESLVVDKLPKDATSAVAKWALKVRSRKQMYEQFLDIYPDIAKYCWGYAPFNWDNERRSILISLNEAPKKGSVILYEVSRNPMDKGWTQMRALLIPYLDYNDIQDWEVRKEE